MTTDQIQLLTLVSSLWTTWKYSSPCRCLNILWTGLVEESRQKHGFARYHLPYVPQSKVNTAVDPLSGHGAADKWICTTRNAIFHSQLLSNCPHHPGKVSDTGIWAARTHPWFLLILSCMLFLQWLAGKNHPMVLQYSGLVCRTSVPRVVKSKGHPVTYPQRVPKHDRNCQELWVLGKTMRGFVHACTSPYSLALTEFNALRVRILFI